MVGNDGCTVRAGADESHHQPIYKLCILPFGFVSRFRLLRQPESPERWESRKISQEDQFRNRGSTTQLENHSTPTSLCMPPLNPLNPLSPAPRPPCMTVEWLSPGTSLHPLRLVPIRTRSGLNCQSHGFPQGLYLKVPILVCHCSCWYDHCYYCYYYKQQFLFI